MHELFSSVFFSVLFRMTSIWHFIGHASWLESSYGAVLISALLTCATLAFGDIFCLGAAMRPLRLVVYVSS